MSLRKMIDDHKLYATEGRRGVENLAKLCALLGYQDPTYFGQFEGGSLGCLIEFLQDNPGAIEAIVDWIEDNQRYFDLDEDEDEN